MRVCKYCRFIGFSVQQWHTYWIQYNLEKILLSTASLSLPNFPTISKKKSQYGCHRKNSKWKFPPEALSTTSSEDGLSACENGIFLSVSKYLCKVINDDHEVSAREYLGLYLKTGWTNKAVPESLLKVTSLALLYDQQLLSVEHRRDVRRTDDIDDRYRRTASNKISTTVSV